MKTGCKKYWILTIEDRHWKQPESIESLSNVKYIRGQQEFSENEFLHWQIAVEYFEPTTFCFVRDQFPKAHVEPIYSLSSWTDALKENTFGIGTRFELGDSLDLKDAISLPEPNVFSQDSHKKWNINDLEKRLVAITENLYFLQKESLEILWNAVENAEMINLIDSIDLLDYDQFFDEIESQTTQEFHGLLTPPKSEKPRNHGKIWEDQDIQELETLLKQELCSFEEISEKLGRTRKSIEIKSTQLVIRAINGGIIPKEAIKLYGDRVSMEMLRKYIDFKNRKPNFYKKRKKE